MIKNNSIWKIFLNKLVNKKKKSIKIKYKLKNFKKLEKKIIKII